LCAGFDQAANSARIEMKKKPNQIISCRFISFLKTKKKILYLLFVIEVFLPFLLMLVDI